MVLLHCQELVKNKIFDLDLSTKTAIRQPFSTGFGKFWHVADIVFAHLCNLQSTA